MTGPLQALAARYDRLATRGEVPAYGYSMETISYSLVLSSEGSLIDIQPFLSSDGKKIGQSRLVPQSFKRPGITPRSFFLWDKTSFVLGVARHKSNKDASIITPAQHAVFKDLHEELLAGTNDAGLQVLLTFLRGWKPERFASPPFTAEMLDTNLVFRLDGDVLVHDRPEARRIWASRLGSADAVSAMCLVTGAPSPVARLHPAIKGVMGAQSSGASLVSFNLDAFTSYGKEQGANAPVSELAAFGYGTVLNGLLAKGSRNIVRIGDATVVFWAEIPEAEAIGRGLFDQPPPDAQGEAAVVRDVLEEMARGRPIEQVVPAVDPSTRFYMLGLSPNAARLSVRFWHETTFGDLARRFQEHWQDLRLEPPDWKGRLPALWRLLYELAPQSKAENVPAHLAGELTRSVLTGRRYPRSLLAVAIMRMRADRAVNGRRAAICKAVLVRELRLENSSSVEDHFVSLDPDEASPGYRLGRLFAVLENVQRAALGRNVNATIRDRYYGAASATPSSVFPLLIRNANHHLANIRKASSGGLAYTLEKEMGQILDGLGAAFPRNLRLEDQGRFAIGYYHERFSRKSGLPVDDADTADNSDAGN